MKTVKTIIWILVILTIAFFSIGLIVKEVTYTAEVTVNKPIEKVFPLFNDETRIKEWIPEIVSITAKEKKPSITGSTFDIKIINNGNEVIVPQKVLAHVPNQKVTLFFKAENILKTDQYIFLYNDKQTVITLNSRCKSESFMLACVFPFFKGKLQQQDQQYLNNFKKIAESEE